MDVGKSVMKILDSINGVMWGPAMMVLLLGTGIFLTIRYRGVQFRKLWYALKLTFNKKSITGEGESGDISPFQALTTTLAATVGNGNIAGVAIAIVTGGPGALLWMWVAALVGMATRCTEALLGLKYRRQAQDGTYIGGAFYYLEDGVGKIIGHVPAKILAIAFAVAGMIATFGIGNMVQANSVALSFAEMLRLPPASIPISNTITGIVLVVMTSLVLIGGVKWIGKFTSKIVPIMGLLYFTTALIILIANITRIPAVFGLIFSSAFTGKAAIGGLIGITVAKAVSKGISRGIFSNEAGLGTGSLAHSAAKNSEPAKQGLIAMVGTFIDTIIICSMTGLVIILALSVDGKMPVDAAGKTLTSAALTIYSFNHFLPKIGAWVVAISSILFGYSTLIGWYYYGEQCTEYLFGVKSNIPYRILFVIAIYFGAVTKIAFVWTLSDILNGFMAIPNLVGLILLSGIAAREMREWLKKSRPVRV